MEIIVFDYIGSDEANELNEYVPTIEELLEILEVINGEWPQGRKDVNEMDYLEI